MIDFSRSDLRGRSDAEGRCMFNSFIGALEEVRADGMKWAGIVLLCHTMRLKHLQFNKKAQWASLTKGRWVSYWSHAAYTGACRPGGHACQNSQDMKPWPLFECRS